MSGEDLRYDFKNTYYTEKKSSQTEELDLYQDLLC